MIGLNLAQHSCDSKQFYSILELWWNQKFEQTNLNQLSPNQLSSISGKYLKECEMHQIAKYLGFYQPKNGKIHQHINNYIFYFENIGTCGLVAALHSIYLYKLWDKYITDSMKKMSNETNDDECKENDQIPIEFKLLFAQSIAHSLLIAVKAGQNSIQYNSNILQSNKTAVAQTWICTFCNAKNAIQNAFCIKCYQEPQKSDEPDTNASEQPKEEFIRIPACNQIYIVYDGHIPENTNDNDFDVNSFDFKIQTIDYDSKEDDDTVTDNIVNQLMSFDFDSNFIQPGCCIRILLSLLMSHGCDRCKYELVLAEYEKIHREFRDSSLIIGPYGFCSQNLVNLCLFGHCSPMIGSVPRFTTPYGFLGIDVINPASTGFFQIGYGHEYPSYPIWTVLSGTHYTTLFALPTHKQAFNGEHVLDQYHAMMTWLYLKNVVKKKKNGKNKKTVSDDTPIDWICNCGNKNQASYVFCSTCASEPPKETEEEPVKKPNKKKKKERVHFEVDLLSFNGLPPSGPLIAPVFINVITGDQINSDVKAERNRVIKPDDVMSILDDEPLTNDNDNQTKVKYLKAHQLVQRIESKLQPNLYYYELAITADAHFEEVQHWKSCYFNKIEPDTEMNVYLIDNHFLDPQMLPDAKASNIIYEYPIAKWRCASCYLGDDMLRRYQGYNELNHELCKACGKTMKQGLRTLCVKYEHVPLYLRNSKVDKVYKNSLIKLLQKRFRNLINGKIDNKCIPIV